MNTAQNAIGVFDSGMGGLTVLRALKQRLPQESFLYLGDTARLPYGTKSADTVKRYALQMAKILIERHIKALVIACNTATTAALSHLQETLPHIPVLGVVSPGASAAVQATRNQHIAVLATETTIASQAYHQWINQHLPHAHITGHACSVLVALAEAGMIDNRVAREALLHYLEPIQTEDTLLLGCTHFPVFKPLLSTLLPENVRIVDSAHATAETLAQSLFQSGLLNTNPSTTAYTQYLVTDSAPRFQAVGEIFLGEALDKAAIEVVDAAC